MSEQTYAEREDARTAALARLGFGPSFVTSADWGAASFASCQTCGAAVHIDPTARDEEQPAAKHYLWHEGERS